MRFGAIEINDNSYRIRNIRNPTKQVESCTNNVGSFSCSSLEEEFIGAMLINKGGLTLSVKVWVLEVTKTEANTST